MRAAAPLNSAPNVYQTRRAVEEEPPATDYRVEQEQREQPRLRRRRKRMLRRALIGLAVVAVAALGVYLAKDLLLGNQEGSQAVSGTQPVETAALTGYDPSPTLQVGERAKRGINAVTSGLELETYAVTTSNVIARIQTGEDRYDYYLFTADNGTLLGYYEGLTATGFRVCAGDIYHVDESPYLINGQGLPLIDASAYQQYVGADGVLGLMMNGWAIIRDAAGTTFNYINADGQLISPLWFCEAYPFTGESTVAYVDTGNAGEDRYALYELNRAGQTRLWLHAADTTDVVGSACGVAYLKSGDVVMLDGAQTVLCQSNEVQIYVDCAAMVVRSPENQLLALYVNNEQHYDYAYDDIAPIPSDIRWKAETNGGLTLYAVEGAAYPQPLSHYFSLNRSEGQEQVALSTTSVYPVELDALK